eukprot:3885384-Amphidinium_carterae.1
MECPGVASEHARTRGGVPMYQRRKYCVPIPFRTQQKFWKNERKNHCCRHHFVSPFQYFGVYTEALGTYCFSFALYGIGCRFLFVACARKKTNSCKVVAPNPSAEML